VIPVRRASSRASRPALTLVSDRRVAPRGELAVRQEHRPDALILWLTGTLDRATSGLLARELDAQANSSTPVVVDLTGLEFIDSSGVHTLTRAHRLARANGHQLSIEASQVVSRLLEPSNHARPLPGSRTDPGAANNELYYFALAMACATADQADDGPAPAA
jgi:anti-sigma B factor antagonist